jgi:TetR/AcrR family transcriptional repressor of bet genes
MMRPTDREARKNANRQKLIDATIDSIAELGLSDTTVGTVVRRAGLSQGIVNLHFDTKEALLAETLRFLSVEWEAAWRDRLDRTSADPAADPAADPGPDPAGQLQAMLLSVFEPSVFNRRKLAAWHAFYADSKYQSAYRTVAGPSDRLYLETLTGLCRQLIDDDGRGGKGDLDAKLVAKGLRAMTDGLCLDWLTNPRATSRAEARRICLQALRTSFPRHFPLAPPAGATGHPTLSEAAA